MIDELRREKGFPIVPMCRVLGVSKSGYYVWRNHKPSAWRLKDERLKVAIKAAHDRGRGTYGPEKIQEESADVEKIEAGINRIKQFKILPSMSRKGNCWDNVSMESFFGTLKTELVYH